MADGSEDPADAPQDPFAPLPTELHFKILLYLRPRDLCHYERVCKEWGRHYSVLNEVWWRLCMAEWWSQKERPKCMSKNDKLTGQQKKKWKEAFSRITPHAAHNDDAVFVKSKSQPLISVEKDQPELPEEEGVLEGTAYKVEMRAYYKGLRSKPRGKSSWVRVQKRGILLPEED